MSSPSGAKVGSLVLRLARLRPSASDVVLNKRHSTICRMRLNGKVCVEDVLLTTPSWRMVTFSIIAHVDHGKSSLSQRLLEQQGNVKASEETRQSALDTLEVERERGITVKAVTASMLYESRGETWLVNLVDTPGHADFAHEVKRSLACCDGALLLVDAAQGVEAQTLSVANAARSAGVPLIAACSKCDLETADPDEVSLALASSGLLDNDDPETVLRLSAKTGQNVESVLPAVVDAFGRHRPRREGDRELPLRARVVDSRYDQKRGVVCVVQVVDGVLSLHDRVRFLSRGKDEEFRLQELGLLTPAPLRTKALPAGAVGYAICGLRDVRQAIVGDTIAEASASGATQPLDLNVGASGQHLLFASIFPPDGSLFEDMARAVDRLALNDASVSVTREAPRPALGAGLRLGFRGVLHLDVFRQRLRDEFEEDVLFCAPLVPYRLVERARPNVIVREISTLDEWPTSAEEKSVIILEPTVVLVVVVPSDYLGAAIDVLEERCTKQLGLDPGPPKARLCYTAPWSRIVDGLGEALAHTTRGLATLDVESPTWEPAPLVKIDVALNGQVVDALSLVSHKDDAVRFGRAAAQKLKEHVPRQQFEVIIQAKIGTKVIAKERVAPYRKDVLTTKVGSCLCNESTYTDLTGGEKCRRWRHYSQKKVA